MRAPVGEERRRCGDAFRSEEGSGKVGDASVGFARLWVSWGREELGNGATVSSNLSSERRQWRGELLCPSGEMREREREAESVTE